MSPKPQLSSSTGRPSARWVPIGRVLRAHGLGGSLLATAYGDTLGSLRAGEAVQVRTRSGRRGPVAPLHEPTSRTIRAVRALHADRVLVDLTEVEDREAAQA